jgi:hypothetical protein
MSGPTCPRCRAVWSPERERFLCGARRNGPGCIPAVDVAVAWCRGHGLEPVAAERRSLQYRRSHLKLVAAGGGR